MPEGYRHLTHPGKCQIHALRKSGHSGPATARRFGRNRPAVALVLHGDIVQACSRRTEAVHVRNPAVRVFRFGSETREAIKRRAEIKCSRVDSTPDLDL